MKRIVEIIIALLLSFGLFLPVGYAQTVYTIDDVPNVHLQDRNAYVSDPEQKLAKEDIQALNTKLRFLEDSLAVQCAVIVLPAIDSTRPVFAHDLLNKWGLGNKKTERGLLLLFVYDTLNVKGGRGITIATGYGLEADLPDALCKRIQAKVMIPLLKENKLGAGLLAGVEKITHILINQGDTSAILKENETSIEEEYGILINIVAIIMVIVGILLYLRIGTLKNAKTPYVAYAEDIEPGVVMKWILVLLVPLGIPYLVIGWLFRYIYIFNRLRCVKCGSSHVQKPTSKQIRPATKHRDGVELHSFLCKDCGYVKNIETKIKYTSPDTLLKNSSSNDSSSSSSSSSGGSWGGGSSGGGGADSSF